MGPKRSKEKAGQNGNEKTKGIASQYKDEKTILDKQDRFREEWF